MQLVGTLEAVGFGFQDGAFTDPVDGPLQKLSGQAGLSVGPGLRMFYCDKLDVGAGWQFGDRIAPGAGACGSFDHAGLFV